MTQVKKYPTSVTVERPNKVNGVITETDWNSPYWVEADDDTDAYTTEIASISGTQSKPGELRCSGFGFNIPKNSQINKLIVEWEAYCRNLSGGMNGVPNIPSIWLAVPGSDWKVNWNSVPLNRTVRNVVFAASDMPGISPATLNDSGFWVLFNPARNSNHQVGRMSVDYIALIPDYTEPSYTLQSELQTPTGLGEEITYKLKVINTNKTPHTDSVPISISLPTGLVYVGQSGSDGTYNSSTGKWNAIINGDYTAEIELTLKTSAVGGQTVTATVDEYGTSISRTTTVTSPNYTLSSDLPSNVTEEQNLTYHVTVTVDSDLVSTVNVNISIPNGFALVSSSGNGTYSNGVWSAAFTNKTATLTLVLTAVTPGDYSQTISVGNVELTKGITIVSASITECYYTEVLIPQEIQDYLNDGETYIISNNIRVNQASNSIYNGYKNYKLALLQTVNNETTEFLGTRPSQANIYQRCYVYFTYNATGTQKIRIYGQYKELSPQNTSVDFLKFAIQKVKTTYEDAGALPDVPDDLKKDETYATISIPSGDTSKEISLSSFNFSGREKDVDLIVKGLGVIFPYICTAELILTVTLTTGTESAEKSVILDPTKNSVTVGGLNNLWGLKRDKIDLNNITVTFRIQNTANDTQEVQLKNIQFVLYSQHDVTGASEGFTLNGEHSRNYDIMLKSSSDKNEGISAKISTLDISNSQGELITQYNLESKTITLEFRLWGDTVEEAQEKLIAATKFLSNEVNDLGLPIPKVLKFDWDPTRSYNVVLDGEITTDLDIATYTCKAKFTIPEGIGFTDTKITGALGSNDGLTSVRPTITILTTGGSIQLYDQITGQSLTINNEFSAEMNLTIDCDDRTIKGSDGIDYTSKVTLNSFWPVLRGDYDFTTSTGCIIQKVAFKEGI